MTSTACDNRRWNEIGLVEQSGKLARDTKTGLVPIAALIASVGYSAKGFIEDCGIMTNVFTTTNINGRTENSFVRFRETLGLDVIWGIKKYLPRRR